MSLKKTTLFVSIFLVSTSLLAVEGMWLPNLIKALNYSDMQSKGLVISAEEIYSVNNSSMKDAVAHFNGGCTSEVVSSKGLLFTNHHCGYSQIASHSTVKKNYLRDGFWAKNFEDELESKNLFVDFIVRIDDVTSKMLGGSKNEGETDEDFKKRKVTSIQKELTQGTRYLVKVKPFNYGNKYFAFIIERFTDVRLVGAPPSSIGKFGFDTDNWVWPRHTGDFSVFRIYANKDNKPADYSKDNIPYTPKHFFPISLKGVKKGDFSMVYGFPGRTQQFLSSYAVDQTINRSNPARILMRDKSLEVINATMKQSEALRIRYASYQSSVSNAWKKWKGQNFGLIREKALEKKKQQEKEFTRRINNNTTLKARYGDLLPQLKKLYKENEPKQQAFDYFIEMIYSGPPSLSYINTFVKVMENEEKLRESGKWDNEIEKLKKIYKKFISKKEEIEFEKNMWLNMYPVAIKNVRKEYHAGVTLGTVESKIENMFEKSMLLTDGKLLKRLNKANARNVKKIKKDPAYKMVKDFYETWRKKILPSYFSHKDNVTALMKEYSKAIQVVFPTKKYWYDANGTLRISYGQVEGSAPRDGMEYKHFTTAEGIMEKYIPGNDEFDVPEKLINLIENKDYGVYGNDDNDLVICFTGSNHTTGGNSGSPVLNSKGELIGINFDRSWESTMSDIMFSDKICRNITVDIRYVLFVIDKYAGATRLIDEMKLVRNATPEEKKNAEQKALIDKINQEIKENPTDASLYYKKGNAFFEMGNLTRAELNYAKAVSLDPKPEYVKKKNSTTNYLNKISEIGVEK